MNQPPGPDKPDQDGDDLSRLYHKAPRPEPPEIIDARLRKAARQSVAPRRFKAPLIGDWKMPAAVAAVALLGFSLLLQVDDREISIEGLTGEREVLHTRQAEEARHRQIREQEARRRHIEDKAAEVERREQIEQTRLLKERSVGEADPAPALSAPSRTEAPATHELKEEAFLERESRLERKRKADQGDASGVPASAPAQAPPQESDKADVHPPAIEKPFLRMEEPTPSQEPTSTAIPDDPQDWLKDIRALLERGEREAAVESLEAFKARYPDYPLEDDLSALLKNPRH